MEYNTVDTSIINDDQKSQLVDSEVSYNYSSDNESDDISVMTESERLDDFSFSDYDIDEGPTEGGLDAMIDKPIKISNLIEYNYKDTEHVKNNSPEISSILEQIPQNTAEETTVKSVGGDKLNVSDDVVDKMRDFLSEIKIF